jgi:hypothetical protein
MPHETGETSVKELVQVICRVGWLQAMGLDELVHVMHVRVDQLSQGLVATN